MFVYDKSGKAFKVPHSVDRKEWIKTGKFFKENPKEENQKEEKPKTTNTLLG